MLRSNPDQKRIPRPSFAKLVRLELKNASDERERLQLLDKLARARPTSTGVSKDSISLIVI